MSDIFILTEETTEVDENSTTNGWKPGATSAPFAAPQNTATSRVRPKGPKAKKGRSSNADEPPYTPLPVEKPPKPLTPRQQEKADKAQLIKEREADAAAMRINGVDGDVEIPKKPWLTIFSGKRARQDEVAETLTDLAAMLEAGDSELASVAELAKVYANYDIGQAYERVAMLLDRGVTLSAAMADQTDSFPPVVRELIGASQMPKDLHRNLKQAATIILLNDNIKSKIRNSLFQPGFMMFFLALFIIMAVQFLLPMTVSMFSGIGAEVPPLTKVIIVIGGALKWVLIVGVVLLALWMMAWKLFLKRNEKVAGRVDEFALKAPLIGEIMRMSVAARFCDVLAACLAVGMSELEALETAARACGNRALADWVTEHVGRQRFGVVEFGDVSKTELLPWNFRNRIASTASLTRRIEILRDLAKTFHDKSNDRLNRFAERIGPITTGVVVITIVIVVLLIAFPLITFVPTLLHSLGG